MDQQRWYHLQSLAWKFTAILYLIHSSFIIVALSSSMNFCNKSNLLKIIHWWQSLQDLLLLHWFVSVAFWFKNRWVYKQEEPDRSSKGCIGHPALQDDTRWMYLSQTIGCYLFCRNKTGSYHHWPVLLTKDYDPLTSVKNLANITKLLISMI